MRRRLRGDGGSIAIEFAFAAPTLLLLLALVYGYARVAQVSGTLDAGTRDAARTASQARTVEDAEERVLETVRGSLLGAPAECSRSLRAGVVGPFEAGVPVKVTATCRVSLDGLGLPGAPGSVQLTSSFSSPVDRNRGVDEGTGSLDLP